MQVMAKFRDVTAIMVQEETPEADSSEQPKVVIEAVKEWGGWDPYLADEEQQGNVSHFVELEIDASVRFEGLNIRSVPRINNSMCIYLAYPTDIAIIDTEESLPVPFEPEAPPISDIVVCSWLSLEGSKPEDCWIDAPAVNC